MTEVSQFRWAAAEEHCDLLDALVAQSVDQAAADVAVRQALAHGLSSALDARRVAEQVYGAAVERAETATVLQKVYTNRARKPLMPVRANNEGD